MSGPGALIQLPRKNFKDFGSLLKIESKLPEHQINLVFHNLGETGSVAIVMQMADAEILFKDVSEFSNGFIALDFRLGQFSIDIVLAHDAVFNIVQGKEVPVRSAGISFIRISGLYSIRRMHTGNDR